MTLRAHIIEHDARETIGTIGPWLDARGARVTRTRCYRDEPLPSLGEADVLIVMGGLMSVNDEARFPWLRTEKQLLRDAVERGMPVLGICLGSQLIASALGARVYRNSEPEHGWLPVEGVPVAPPAFRFPRTFTTFQSHGDTFDLPAGALHLARSVACEHQAFQIGGHVLALQFHLESNAESAGAIVEHCANEFAPGPFVQSTQSLRETPGDAYAESAALMAGVLDYLTA